MSYPVPPAPGGPPYGGGQEPGQQHGVPAYGTQLSGQGAQPQGHGAQLPAFGAQPQGAAGSASGFGSAPGGPTPPTPPKRRWGIWVAVGCGCLLVLAAIITIIAVTLVNSGGEEEDPTARGTTATSSSPTEQSTSDAPPTTSRTVATTTSQGPAPVTPEDLTAAGQTMVDLTKALIHGDVEGICRTVLNPITKQPYQPSEISLCTNQMQQYAGGGTEEQKRAIDTLTPDQVITRANDDGTITAAVANTQTEFTLRRGADGGWYVDLSTS